MKNLFFILMIGTFIVACKKETSTQNTHSNSSIVGTWHYSADTVTQYKNGIVQFVNDSGFGITSADYFQFNSDGSGQQVIGSNKTQFTYSLSNNTVTINTPAQTLNSVPIAATVEKATIKNLKSSSMELYFDDTGTADNGDVIRDTESAYFTK